MNPGYITALAVLIGSAIGGVTSFATAWLTLLFQLREKRVEAELSKREALYISFITSAAKVFAHAAQNDDPDDKLETIAEVHALVDCIRLRASEAVVREAENVLIRLLDAYLEPKKTFRELHQQVIQTRSDPLRTFSEVCREEMRLASGSAAERWFAGR